MRQAMSRLVADDLIARQAGRGTFVKPQTDRADFYLDRSFTRQSPNLSVLLTRHCPAASIKTWDNPICN
jgi:DNA-binding GntR family transcriptional regulator